VLRRKAILELSESLSLPVQVFFFWLVLILWRRAAQHQDFAGVAYPWVVRVTPLW
jgi:hypothetical protein